MSNSDDFDLPMEEGASGQIIDDAPIDLSGFPNATAKGDSDEGGEPAEPETRSVLKGAPRPQPTEADRIASRERLLGARLPEDKIASNAQAEKNLPPAGDSPDDMDLDIDLSDSDEPDPALDSSDGMDDAGRMTDIAEYVSNTPPAKPAPIRRSASAQPATPLSNPADAEMASEMEDLLAFLGKGPDAQPTVLSHAPERVHVVPVEETPAPLALTEEVSEPCLLYTSPSPRD